MNATMDAVANIGLLTETARAKLNLALHVVGRRHDGYHDLDTVVAFPTVSDTLSAEPSRTLSLEVEGPFAAALDAGADNLVIRAAEALRAATGCREGAAIRLVKRLPVASGIGGGSADAAAALRMLTRLWNLDLEDEALSAIAGPLGADVPMCLHSEPLRARGTGHDIERLPALPDAAVVLVNSRAMLATPAVFRTLGLAAGDRDEARAVPDHSFAWRDAADLAAWLMETRNDLEPPARRLEPSIDGVLAALNAMPGALLARLSGSGATCFAVFADLGEARHAAAKIADARPEWWVESAPLSG
ncbi:4-diphosphocytidyl-2-C-methyl-D-erythritol kinase [Pseudoxanthobacter soli DSM 19599]|uniref:4-diphosphocytidyl-2-C-methyl-D-erythritol kinase n=1 Tax=Pseudoxanthobacter soli DSM 19599 TaxID=1123029 RepID=A0A1M7Z4R6_9HYPH|nr:4-(cytidine 5'-diphospho)-2-C-methyl-D-erythritol kinase [Pseudoxanthobacter soli]SHO59666.1 4-diphosphocytidyl-2-C-methyl-D-erythritol kinase [Pseudoxanthobacter soli DSM 19599]